MTPATKTLRQILVKIADNHAQGVESLAVFDLDSTLFDVGPRLERILTDFAQEPEYQRKFPEQLRFFKNLKVHRKDWGLQDALVRAGLAGEDLKEFQEALKNFWRRTFFSDDYLHHDIPYPGAVEFVQNMLHCGGRVAYLTGRDVHRMGKGTAEVLLKWNFPLNERAELALKPHLSMDDAEFKTNWFLSVPEKRYGNIWFFENEPVNIHHTRLKAAHASPPIEIVFFDSTHSRRAAAPTDLPSIAHFLMDDEEES
ncbi:MAG: HAD family hydrolase [Bdellovibrionaceae bacterium]|nr:HAD family hydrolase [Pseudobdellovibrionaceae bacterium]